MRIAIDVQPLQTGPRIGGMRGFLWNLLQKLDRIDRTNEYTYLLKNAGELSSLSAASETWRKHYLTRKHLLGRWWWQWDTVQFPTVFIKKGIDIYHYNSLAEAESIGPPPPFGRHRVVATVYDLLPLNDPGARETSSAGSRWKRKFTKKLRRLEHVDAMVTPSQFVKQELVKVLDFPPDRIWVTPPGLGAAFTSPFMDRPHCQERQPYKLEEPYILYVGGYSSARKNIEDLLKAYQLLRRSLSPPCPNLVLAGLAGSRQQESLFARIRELNLPPHVIALPQLTPEALPALYRGAALFVYPSRYEGFCLPIVEAMACGAVIAASNTSSIPEILGDAGLYFDPADTRSIASTMHEGLTNAQTRDTLRQRGPARAARFSSDHTARVMLSVYDHVHRYRH